MPPTANGPYEHQAFPTFRYRPTGKPENPIETRKVNDLDELKALDKSWHETPDFKVPHAGTGKNAPTAVAGGKRPTKADGTPYEHEAFPSFRYRFTGDPANPIEAKIVRDQDEDDALGDEWHHHPDDATDWAAEQKASPKQKGAKKASAAREDVADTAPPVKPKAAKKKAAKKAAPPAVAPPAPVAPAAAPKATSRKRSK